MPVQQRLKAQVDDTLLMRANLDATVLVDTVVQVEQVVQVVQAVRVVVALA